MRLRFLPGQPIESAAEDGLAVAPFIDSVQRSPRATETPFVYGLLGDWGMGTTSVLRPLEGRLKQELETGPGALVPIWFNVRHYENEVNLVYPLLYALRQAQQADRRITALAGARGSAACWRAWRRRARWPSATWHCGPRPRTWPARRANESPARAIGGGSATA